MTPAYHSALNIHVYVSAVFFATCLAPISREYGWKAGFVAGMLVPIFDVFFRKHKEKRLAKLEQATQN